METVINDEVFGEMRYKYRWYKREKLTLFGREWDITVAAKDYSGKEITDAQRSSYRWYLANSAYISETIAEKLINYINTNCEALAEDWHDARKVGTAAELDGILTPTALIVKQEGTMIVLLDCVWDEEHGIGIQIFPEYVIGSQDVFL